jgi:hypothetical protein
MYPIVIYVQTATFENHYYKTRRDIDNIAKSLDLSEVAAKYPPLVVLFRYVLSHSCGSYITVCY